MTSCSKIGALFLALVITLILLGCRMAAAESQGSKPLIVRTSDTVPSGPAGQAVEAGQKTFALVMKTLTNPFFIDMEKGARKAERELGIKLLVKTGAKETSIDQQIAIVEELISLKVDAIVIAPGSSTELVPVVKKAQSAGITVINIDNKLDEEMSKRAGLLDVPFVSVDNEHGAYLSAKFIADKIINPAEVAILEGIRDAKNAQDRKAGADRAFLENRNIKLVISKTANWKIDEAAEVTSKLFRSYPDIKAMFCANDMMALGAIHQLEQMGKVQKVQIAAFDALPEAKKALLEGKLAVTIDQQANLQGYTGVHYAMRALKGEKIPLETLVDVKLVHAGNVQ